MPWINPFYDAALAHHTPEGFRNLDPETREPGGLKRWRRERKEQGVPKPPAEGYDAFTRRWFQPAEFSGVDDAAWWLGHATVLVRRGGLNVLTDPVLGQRASPLSFAGPARRTPTPVGIAGLPRIEKKKIGYYKYYKKNRSEKKMKI